MPDGTKKRRIVVNIKNFNKISIKNCYPIRTQEEIIIKLDNYKYIIVFDTITFYY